MLRSHLLVCAAVLAVFFIPLTASAELVLGATLTGEQAVPVTTATGFASASVAYDEAFQHVTVTIYASDLTQAPSKIEIGEGRFGVAGSTVLNLTALGATFQNGTLTITVPIDSALAKRMAANPNGFYVNMAAPSFSLGFVRGQLAYAKGGPIRYFVDLEPAIHTQGQGAALVTFNPYNGGVTWEINTNETVATSTSAVIRRGAPGSDGPVVAVLASNAQAIPDGSARGSALIDDLKTTDFTAADLVALSNSETASNYYLEIDSAKAPGGEVRGQLAAAQETDIPVAGHIVNAAGQTFVTDLSIFNPEYNVFPYALIEYFPSGSTSDLPAASFATRAGGRSPMAFKDLVRQIWGLTQSVGALRITSISPLIASAHTYLDERATGRGTLGQSTPGVARQNALRRGVMTDLANGVSGADSYRTNLGFFNPTDSAVAVALLAVTDVVRVQATIIVPAHGHVQNSIVSFFPERATEMSRAPHITVTFDAAGPIVGYASVVDNVSGDSSYVPSISDPVIPATRTF
jgi:hypothetical protein